MANTHKKAAGEKPKAGSPATPVKEDATFSENGTAQSSAPTLSVVPSTDEVEPAKPAQVDKKKEQEYPEGKAERGKAGKAKGKSKEAKSAAEVPPIASKKSESEPVSDKSTKMKRLTLDIAKPLHKAIKARAVEEGIPMVDMLRSLLEEHYGK
jgi:predicted DNA binding CopG/RHH family protein